MNTGYFLRRIVSAVPTLFGVITIAFFIIRLIPGDPALAILGPYATEESILALRQDLGLDQPLLRQYYTYVTSVLRGDLGNSLSARRPVLQEIIRQFPPSLHLALCSVFISFLLGVPTGIVAATRNNTYVDHIARFFCLIGISLPIFLIGIILIYLFSYQIRIFPSIGMGDSNNPINMLYYLVLPSFSIGFYMSALVSRLTRSCMLEILGDDYIRTARAKGLAERVVLYKHALRNAMIPIITIIGLSMCQLIGGAIIIESVFARPGLGKLILDGILGRDYPLVQGGMLILATLVIVINICIDFTYGLIDPSVEYK